MKKQPTFLLVRRTNLDNLKPEPQPASKASGKKALRKAVERSSGQELDLPYDRAERAARTAAFHTTELNQVFSSLSTRFRHTLVDSFVTTTASKSKKSSGAGATIVNQGLATVAHELGRSPGVVNVGVLDLGVWIGELPTLLERLNRVQSLFTIFEIQAPIPAGLLKSQAGIVEWANALSDVPLRKTERDDMQRNVVADDFFLAAEDIRKGMGLDLIVGLTPAMIAGYDAEGLYWNMFASTEGRTSLVSTADLREYARKAGIQFEAAIGALLVPALLVGVNKKLNYHDDTGCLFDYDEDRRSVIKALKNLHFDKRCLALLSPPQRAAALAMLTALNSMRRTIK